MKTFIVDPTSDLSQKHSFAIVMATLIHNGFNLCRPITMLQEKGGIGNIVFTQEATANEGATEQAIIELRKGTLSHE